MKLLVTTLLTAFAATTSFAGVINIDCEGSGATTNSTKGRVGDGTVWNSASGDKTNLVDQFGTTTPVDIDFVSTINTWSVALGNDLQNDCIDSLGGGTLINGFIRELRANNPYRIVIYTGNTTATQSVFTGPTAPLFSPVFGPATAGPLPGEEISDYVIVSATSDSSGNLEFTVESIGGGLARIAGIQIQGWLPGESRSQAFQSDLSISKRTTGGFKGEGIYSHRPSGSQTKTARSKRRKKVTQYVKIANAGDVRGEHEIDGDKTNRKVRRVYRDAANVNITSQVVTATYRLELYPEASTHIKVKTKPKRRAGKKEYTNIFAAPVDHDVNAATDVVTSRLKQVR